jgi:hypothetical protein
MSLESRMARLENALSRDEASARTENRPPPLFWQGLCGAVPLDQLPPETRKIIEPMFRARRPEPDPTEERIEALLRRQLTDPSTPRLAHDIDDP